LEVSLEEFHYQPPPDAEAALVDEVNEYEDCDESRCHNDAAESVDVHVLRFHVAGCRPMVACLVMH